VSKKKTDARTSPARYLLRQGEQLVVGTAIAAALLSMAAYWFSMDGHRGRLIDIDRAEPLAAEFKVDINAAEWPELAQLPGLGEELARRIVAARTAGGPFIDHDDLQNRVPGIGRVKMENLRPYLLDMPSVETVAGQ
jgi:competence protein ComEA